MARFSSTSLVSQTVKNLKSGISQQPDILRFAEQGSEQINGWSSESEGLQKRSPIVFTKNLGPKGHIGEYPYVHLINRDEYEQYYACFSGSDVKVFDLSGKEYLVRGDMSYIQSPNPRDDLRMITIADYTFIANNKKTVGRNTTDKSNSGTFKEKETALIVVRGGQYGRTLFVYLNGGEKAKLVLPDGSTPPHVTQTDAQTIAENLATQLRTNLAALNNGTWTVTVGQGYILIQSPSGVDITDFSTKDGYADQLIYPVTHYAQTFAKLPPVAPNDYMVHIVGDTSKTADAYYVQYDANRKVWKEVIGWNQDLTFVKESMPHALIRAADGNFDLKPLDWADRKAGDDDTNPFPSFVGSTINDVFFYRNRLGFLSGENVILSRTARYFDFFPSSVANLSDDDPIDVAVSHNRVSILKYAVPFTEELLLWSDEAQFTMSASGVLTSKTIELNLTTQFDVYDRARPYGIGRNVYFASPRATFTSISRYYAVQDVSAVKNAEDMTAHVPSYIQNGVFNIHGSSTENFASVLTAGAESRIYIYKFLYLNEELRQTSWSHWEFGSNVRVLAASAINSNMCVIIENGQNVFMGYIPFTKDTVDFADEPYRIYLDAKIAYTIPAGTYNEDYNETTIDLDDVYGTRFEKGAISSVAPDGKVWRFEEPLMGWENNHKLVYDGNLEGVKMYIGFNFNFRYVFSKFLIKKTADDGSVSTEDTGRLQLRRAWLNYENTGAFYVEVENLSRLWTYTMGGGRLGSDNVRVGMLSLGTGQFRFPVAGNALYNTVRILSDHTTPLNVIGCGWEGAYTSRTSGI